MPLFSLISTNVLLKSENETNRSTRESQSGIGILLPDPGVAPHAVALHTLPLPGPASDLVPFPALAKPESPRTQQAMTRAKRSVEKKKKKNEMRNNCVFSSIY